MLVVHSHFHPRRTGVTGHVEQIVPALGARGLGRVLSPHVPRITWGELWRRARSEDVVWHAHRNTEVLVALLFRVVAPRLKVVFTRHDSRPPGAWTRLLCRFVDALVTLTAEQAALLSGPSEVVGHGVDAERFAPPEDRPTAFRALGLPGAHGLGVVGRVRPEKGQGELVEAVVPLLSRHPGWTVALVGETKPEDRAFASSLEARGDGRVHLVGVKDDVAAWYRGLSVLVQPSHREAFSMVILEAMAAGCCVVASRVGAAAQVIEHGVTGFLFEAGDVQGLGRVLEPLLADPDLVARVGQAAAAHVRERHSVAAQARALEAVYRRVVGR